MAAMVSRVSRETLCVLGVGVGMKSQAAGVVIMDSHTKAKGRKCGPVAFCR